MEIFHDQTILNHLFFKKFATKHKCCFVVFGTPNVRSFFHPIFIFLISLDVYKRQVQQSAGSLDYVAWVTFIPGQVTEVGVMGVCCPEEEAHRESEDKLFHRLQTEARPDGSVANKPGRVGKDSDGTV